MTEHTPTPWVVEKSTGEMDGRARYETGSNVLIIAPDDCEYHPIADCSCNHSCRMPDDQEANAAFIVKAVNNYDHLVTALVEILAHAEDGSWTLPSSFAARARSALSSCVGGASRQGERS